MGQLLSVSGAADALGAFMAFLCGLGLVIGAIAFLIILIRWVLKIPRIVELSEQRNKLLAEQNHHLAEMKTLLSAIDDNTVDADAAATRVKKIPQPTRPPAQRPTPKPDEPDITSRPAEPIQNLFPSVGPGPVF